MPRIEQMPVFKRQKLDAKRKKDDKKTFAEIMENVSSDDSELEIDDTVRFLPPEKRPYKKKVLNFSSDEESDSSEKLSKKSITAKKSHLKKNSDAKLKVKSVK